MTTPPDQPGEPGISTATVEDRFDRRVAFGVVAALALMGAVSPFGWHLFSKTSTTVVNGAAVVADAAVRSQDLMADANASCSTAMRHVPSVNTAGGNVSTIGDWAITATPSVDALRSKATALRAVVARRDTAAVPGVVKSLCDQVNSETKLGAMRDRTGTSAWQAALTAYAAVGTDVLTAPDGDSATYRTADARLRAGEQQLDVLSARIISTTR